MTAVLYRFEVLLRLLELALVDVATIPEVAHRVDVERVFALTDGGGAVFDLTASATVRVLSSCKTLAVSAFSVIVDADKDDNSAAPLCSWCACKPCESNRPSAF